MSMAMDSQYIAEVSSDEILSNNSSGPMFYADTVGLPKIVDAMKKYGREHPNVSHWKISPFLNMLAAQNMSLMDFVLNEAKKLRAKSKQKSKM